MPTIYMGKFISLRQKNPQLPGHMRNQEAGRAARKVGAGPREVEREELKSAFLGIVEWDVTCTMLPYRVGQNTPYGCTDIKGRIG